MKFCSTAGCVSSREKESTAPSSVRDKTSAVPFASRAAPSVSSPCSLRNSRRAAASCASSATKTSACETPSPSCARSVTVPAVPLATDGCCGSHSTRTSAPAGALPAPPSSSEEGAKLVPVELPGALSPSGCPSGWLPEEALAEELAIELPKELPEELPEALSEELPGVLPGAWPSCAKASACAGSMARQIAAASTALNRRCFHRMC